MSADRRAVIEFLDDRGSYRIEYQGFNCCEESHDLEYLGHPWSSQEFSAVRVLLAIGLDIQNRHNVKEET